jgi:alginate O-acetyltransferase complex protein AlgI
MLFSSVVFLFWFLPLFFLLYFASPLKIKNYLILAGSIFFYSWGGPSFIFAILFTTLLDFILVRAMHKAQTKKWIFLLTSLTINLGLLFYFKYFNFFVDNFNEIWSPLTGNNLYLETIILPIGISFYTFESITYIVDVYRGHHKPLAKFSDYLLYILFFPKLIAGPIIRFGDFGHQITDRKKQETADMKLAGMIRFIIGLSKKVLLANLLGETAHHIYDVLDPAQQSTGILWIASFAYTLQIYFDFSGYSDMAIGLAQMMGFVIPENFNFPYISSSITEFWRRWHISLGTWMKNYLYIPLGGNKNGNANMYRNLFIVFLLSGFWHGASWNFVIWGMIHGLFLIADKLFLLKVNEKIPRIIPLIFTLFIVNLTWVIFRTENADELKVILYKMFVYTNADNGDFVVSGQFISLSIIGLFISLSGLIPGWYHRSQNTLHLFTYHTSKKLIFTISCLILGLIALSHVVASDFNPFIYFRF